MHALKKCAHLCAVFFIFLLISGCNFSNLLDPMKTQFKEEEPALTYDAIDKNLPTTYTAGDPLTVMTWNLKYGGGRFIFGWEKDGTRYNMTASEVTTTLEDICAYLTTHNPDILLVQEIDRNSKRSGYMDQIEYILNHTPLNYAVYAAIWKGDIIPADGMQRMDTGNAVFSKWPIHEGTRLSLPLLEQDALTDYFYFKRNLLRARVAVPGQDNFYVLNIHTDAFSKEEKNDQHIKKRQIDFFKAEMDRLVATGAIVLGGGDFNAMPGVTDNWGPFDDMVTGSDTSNESYVGEETWMDELYTDYNSAIDAAVIDADNASYFTFPSTYADVKEGQSTGAWNRMLDHIFTNLTIPFSGGQVLQDSWSGPDTNEPMSDHAPILATLEV